MPKKTGQDLIVACQQIRPAIKTVLCSGYMDEAADERQLPHTVFMHKPIDWRELSRIVQVEVQEKG